MFPSILYIDCSNPAIFHSVRVIVSPPIAGYPYIDTYDPIASLEDANRNGWSDFVCDKSSIARSATVSYAMSRASP